MSSSADAESLAQSAGEAGSTDPFADGIVLIGFADSSQGSDTLLDAGIVHAARVEIVG